MNIKTLKDMEIGFGFEKLREKAKEQIEELKKANQSKEETFLKIEEDPSLSHYTEQFIQIREDKRLICWIEEFFDL